jgi:LSD1 subclass zinc finger protein
MPVQINCPSCRGPLRVPEELFGQRVQCPDCQAIFIAEVDDTPTVRVAPPPPPPPTPRLRTRLEEGPRPESRGRIADQLLPHRGGLILTLGILSLVFHCVPLGIAAWVMGANDLAAMRRGEMNRAGEGVTQAGRICGMISSLVFIVWAGGTLVAVVCRLVRHAFFW